MANVSLTIRTSESWVARGGQPATSAWHKVPVTISLLGVFVVAVQAGQPLVGLASMMVVLATATALSFRTLTRRDAPIVALRQQGDQHMGGARYADAARFYERALALAERGPESTELLVAAYNMALVSSTLEDHPRAALCTSRVFELLSSHSVPRAWTAALAWVLRRCARYYSAQGQHDAAIEACTIARTLVGDAPGADDRTVCSLLDDLGWAEHRSGRFRASEQSFRAALALHEQYRDLAEALVGPQLDREGPVASPYRVAGSLARTTSGGLDRAVAQSSIGLGWTLLELGQAACAEGAFARALLLLAARSSAHAHLRMEAWRGRAATCCVAGKLEEAEQAYQRADASMPNKSPAQALAITLDRAALALDRDQLEQADDLLMHAEQQLHALPESLSLAISTHRVAAELHLRVGNNHEALRRAKQAIALVAEVAPAHPCRATVLALGARAFAATDDFEASERCAKAAREVLQRSELGREHPRAADVELADAQLEAVRRGEAYNGRGDCGVGALSTRSTRWRSAVSSHGLDK